MKITHFNKQSQILGTFQNETTVRGVSFTTARLRSIYSKQKSAGHIYKTIYYNHFNKYREVLDLPLFTLQILGPWDECTIIQAMAMHDKAQLIFYIIDIHSVFKFS